ncbi:MAG: hypothetical protein ACI81P_000530 [Neolewinella sp.]|jgi:hypothetical protein
MDFWTAFPYWGILVLIGINALLVLLRKVEVEDREGDEVGH